MEVEGIVHHNVNGIGKLQVLVVGLLSIIFVARETTNPTNKNLVVHTDIPSYRFTIFRGTFLSHMIWV
jgi:hypothetical protein